MRKQNFLDHAKHNLRDFSWPIWFPYPSSWLRALILVPIALPSTHLIVFGLTGIIISIIENSPLLLFFSIAIGLILPASVLAFFYHFFWYIRHKRSSKSFLSKLMPSFISFWHGLYTIFVLSLSFIIITAVFSELAFLDCKVSENVEFLNLCTGRFTERALKLILSNINNGDFLFKPWFVFWLFNASYLYQIEHLFRKILHTYTKAIFKSKTSPKDYTLDLGYDVQDEIKIVSAKKRNKKQGQVELSDQNYRPKAKKIRIVRLIFNLLIFGGAGIYLYFKFPEMKNNLSLYISSRQLSYTVKPDAGIFQKGLNKAINAANLTKKSKSHKEWKTAITQWQAAIALMKTVPPSSPNYAVAQQQITEYKKSLGYPEKNTKGAK